MPMVGFRHVHSGVVLLALMIIAAALVATAGDTRARVAGPLPNGFKSVGYLPADAGDVNAIQYGKLTHINYAFVMPDANGVLPDAPNPAKLRDLVRLGHANGVKILISVGGWNDGNDAPFEALAANQAARTAFVTNALAMVTAYDLDGVDIDWEYPDPGASADNFTAMMAALGNALHAKGKLLTAAVISNGNTQGIKSAVFGSVDFLNIMLYDGGTPHANYDWTIAYLNAWKAKGLPAAKTVVGIPFYARPAYASYAQLVARDPLNADRDCTMIAGRPACANGRSTVARKTQWAMANGGGVMYWELSNDTTGDRSLVNVIYENSRGLRSAPISGNAGKCVDVRWGGTANGTPVQLYACNASSPQWWTVDGTGAMRAMGKCLDVPGSSTANGAQLQVWDCNGSVAQKWQARADGTLLNPHSKKCLDAAGFGTTDGTRLQIWDCSGGTNQVWRSTLWTPGLRVGQLIGTSGKCVEVLPGTGANATPIQLYGCTTSGRQWWSVDGTGAVRVLGKCLDVSGSSTANGAPVQLWDCNGSVAQKWQARTDGTLLNPHSNKCLDATAFGTTDGTRLQIWDCSGGTNQAWALP